MKPKRSLTMAEETEMRRMKQYFPYRIVYGVVDKETSEFRTYASATMRQANGFARNGHDVWVER